MKTVGDILLVVGTLAVVSSLVVTLITGYPVTTGVFAFGARCYWRNDNENLYRANH
jgi:hypothetical protein